MSENTKDTLTKSIDKTKENEEKKKDIYNKYKNLPIYDAIKKCDEDFRNFTKSDVGKMHKINEDKNIDLALALKNVPKYHHYVESYSQQINLSSEIDKLAKKRNIMSLLDIQQKVISKINEKGKNSEMKLIIIVKRLIIHLWTQYWRNTGISMYLI